MLTNNTYLPIYRSRSCDFDEDFMIPSFKESVLLERGSGYFSLKSLVLSMQGIIPFVTRKGHIRLVCNPELKEADVEMIAAGLTLDRTTITQRLLEQVESETLTEADAKNMNIICNMIAEGYLEIRIAFMPQGIYHEKFGVFTDEEGNMLYFNGSVNETPNAKLYNFESITTQTSWNGAKAFIINESRYFKRLWDNMVEDIDVMEFPEALQKRLFNDYKYSDSLDDALSSMVCEDEKDYNKKQLYPYQQQAIQEFVDNGFVHFYEMATGTGKTFTAIKTISRLQDEIKQPICTLILVPQIDLQYQWKRALEDEGFEEINLIGGLSKDSAAAISNAIISYADGESSVAIAVYDSYFTKAYNSFGFIDNLFLIVDEAHNIARSQFKKLPKKAPYRLGLSATIQRFNDAETKDILNYFTNGTGETFYYGIDEAIANGFLSNYNYYPIFVHLDSSEFSRYQSLTKQIATEMNKDDCDEEKLNRLRRDRSLIVKQTSSKTDKIEEMANNRQYDFTNSVVYCGQGTDKDTDERIIDSVSRILHDADYGVNHFDSHTIDRKSVLQEFERGYYDTLIAIRCFDEGVDVPKLDKIYIMASEGALRQTVQRRGRVLRKCKETGKTIAHIYDMITLPPEAAGHFANGADSLVKNEMIRAFEYNRLSLNHDEVKDVLLEIMNQYFITEEDLQNDREGD